MSSRCSCRGTYRPCSAGSPRIASSALAICRNFAARRRSNRCSAAGATLAAPGVIGSRAVQAIEAADALVTGKLTIDMHSHGGGFIREDSTADPVADAMRTGGMAVACLAIVSDAPTHQVFPDRRI